MYIGVIMARLRSNGISPVFSEILYSSWRGWARFLLHCLRNYARNSSGHLKGFCEIVFIVSMMSSLVILMSDSVFAFWFLKKSFGYLTSLISWVRRAQDTIILSIDLAVRSFFLFHLHLK